MERVDLERARAQFEGRTRRSGEALVAVAVSTTTFPHRPNFGVLDLAAVLVPEGELEDVGPEFRGWNPVAPAVVSTATAFRARIDPGPDVDLDAAEVRGVLANILGTSPPAVRISRKVPAAEALARFDEWLGARRMVTHTRTFTAEVMDRAAGTGTSWARDRRWVTSLSNAAEKPMAAVSCLPVLKGGAFKRPSMAEMLSFYGLPPGPHPGDATSVAQRIAVLYQAMARAGHVD